MYSASVEKEYIYSRIKNIIHDSDVATQLFLFAGLTKITTKSGYEEDEKEVKVLASVLIESSIQEVPQSYLDIPDGEIRIHVNKLESVALQKAYEVDLETFLTFRIND